MGNNRIQYDNIAKRVLAEYDIGDYDLAFIRHSDTVTYRVDASYSAAYLLRIHIPVTVAMGSHGQDVQMLNSELVWLEALNRDTDLILQRPVRNLAGALVTQVETEDALVSCNCTLLHWIKGQPYHRDLESEQTAYQIGEIMAKLHAHASRWQLPEDFHRPRRDIEYFTGVLRGLHPALKDGRITSEDYAEFEKSIELVNDMLNPLNETRSNSGIMHADAHKGNMLIANGEIRLIDFSFCAFGNFMFDLGVCLSDMKPNLHATFLQGYQSLRILPENYRKLVEGFFVGSVVGTFSFWVQNPQAQELLLNKFPQIARNYAAKFNQGEYFWFS
jgi:Ser/Thr protein kinase RdoA (MazF antagonist)